LEPYTIKRGTKNIRNTSTFVNKTIDSVFNINSSTSGNVTAPNIRQTMTPSASGFRNPLWRTQISQGLNATTGFTGIDFSDDPDCFISVTEDIRDLRNADSAYRQTHDENDIRNPSSISCPLSVSIPGSAVTDVTNRCLRQFLSSYHSIQSSFEAGQDFGEWKETLASVRHPLNSLRTSLLSYLSKLTKARKKVRGVKALRKVLADTYLEFHFGWQPLAADAASLITDFARKRYAKYPISAKASTHSTGSTRTLTISGCVSAFSNRLTHTYVETSTYKVRYKGGVRVRNLGANGQISLAQSLQLTPDRWLPTAWDLLPYSWMADYFINIGDVIDSLSSSLFADLTWSCKTTRAEIHRQYGDVSFAPPSPPATGWHRESSERSCTGGTCEVWYREVGRSALVGSDLVASLQLKLPRSPWPFANIGAILLQKSKPLIPFF